MNRYTIRKGKRVEKKKQSSIKYKFMELIKRHNGYYYDVAYKKPKRNNCFMDIVTIILLVAAMLLIGCILCDVSYKIGYNHKFEEEYDSMYQMAKYDAYYDVFMKGLSAVKTDGIERKTKLIAAYNSLIRYEGLSEIDRKAYTYRLNELLRSPVPEEEKVDQFIGDVQQILSTDT